MFLVKSSIQRYPLNTVHLALADFRQTFNSIKLSTIKCLIKCQIAVRLVVGMLMSLRAVDEEEIVLEESALFECKHHFQLFDKLSDHMNYLVYYLLDQLIEELSMKYSSFESIGGNMARYKYLLQKFKRRTTLEMFCQTQDSGEDPPRDFKKIVVKHKWHQTITLDDVERFRRRYEQSRHYSLERWIMVHITRSRFRDLSAEELT